MPIMDPEPPGYPHPAAAVCRAPGSRAQRRLGQLQQSGEEEE